MASCVLVKQSTAQSLGFFLVQSSDHLTGKTSAASIAVQMKKYGETSFTTLTITTREIGNGHYEMDLTTTHMDTVGLVSIRVTATGCDPCDMPNCIDVVAVDKTSATRGFSGTALPDAAAAASGGLYIRGTGAGAINQSNNGRIDVDTQSLATDSVNSAALASSAVTEIQSGLATSSAVSNIQSDTDDIQSRLPAALVSGRMDASVGAMAANVMTAAAAAADLTTELQAGLATSAEVAGVQADTDDIQTRLPAALVGGRMDSSVGAMAANVITAASMAASAGTEIAAAVWGYVTEGTWTAVEIYRLLAGKILGKATGQEGATHTYRDIDDSKNRIVETYTAGDRTPTSRDAT